MGRKKFPGKTVQSIITYEYMHAIATYYVHFKIIDTHMLIKSLILIHSLN